MEVLIDVELYKRLMAYVKAFKYEVSGLGKIKKLKNGNILIEDIQVFNQVVTEGSTVMLEEALTQFYDLKMQSKESLRVWKLWWHSHGNMNAYFSATDDATIKDYDSEKLQDNWIMALVVNRQGDIVVRIDVFEPVKLTIKDVPLRITYEDKELEKQIALEIKQKVKLPNSSVILEEEYKEWINTRKHLIKEGYFIPVKERVNYLNNKLPILLPEHQKA